MRSLWIALGGLFFALGVIGAVLPLLPTTPFMLLAAGCFAKGSPRLHAWLLSHKTFGPLISNWRAHGAIPRRAKVIAVAMMAATFALSVGLGLPSVALIPQGLVLSCVALFLITRPEGPKAR
ncbi:YbaN family protein [Falsigemmobacter intermedius]|uniref:DUF454 domain-containing protein n=1 Tax=Falsigemmobacter intermedius TaxID=1553448 RepID=A0A444MAV9_9RHOB|nr:YbaN family protein [Falsigemmobacter intermedius]RWY40592.1 DUF454 domain-containing protein [Falsigemmobacter intermedius]